MAKTKLTPRKIRSEVHKAPSTYTSTMSGTRNIDVNSLMGVTEPPAPGTSHTPPHTSKGKEGTSTSTSTPRYKPPLSRMRLTCHICYKTLANLSSLKRHINKLHNQQSLGYECPMCFKKCTRKNNYLKHAREIHGFGVRAPEPTKFSYDPRSEAITPVKATTTKIQTSITPENVRFKITAPVRKYGDHGYNITTATKTPMTHAPKPVMSRPNQPVTIEDLYGTYKTKPSTSSTLTEDLYMSSSASDSDSDLVTVSSNTSTVKYISDEEEDLHPNYWSEDMFLIIDSWP